MNRSQEMIALLKKHRNENEGKAMAAYQRNQFTFLGIKSLQRRELTKPFFAEVKADNKQLLKTDQKPKVDWPFVNQLWEADEREFQYVAADYLQIMDRYLELEDLDSLRKLITHKSWWDSVDALVKRVGTLVLKYPQLNEEMLAWSMSENMWLRRTAIIHQLSLKGQTNTTLLANVIKNNFASDEFFINKAIGWALRDYAKTDEQWTQAFVHQYHHQLSSLSIREALKNIG